MALYEQYTLNGVTISGTETSIISGTSTLQNDYTNGVYQLWLDASAMAIGDEFLVRVYEKVLASSTKRLFFQQTLSDAQSEILVTPSFILLNGWDMTLTKTAGTNRAFYASIRRAG
jgi:hypothetical protein